MDAAIRSQLEQVHSPDRELQTQAYYALLAATDQPVDWAYEAWDELVRDLQHGDNHVRSIAAQVLCSLAKSDPDNRMRATLPLLLALTRDARFVTARHSLQALWKIGAAGPEQRAQLLEGLEARYHECAGEKNGTLIRYDIIQSLSNLHDVTQEPAIRAKALELIELETDLKYRKKYAGLWRGR